MSIVRNSAVVPTRPALGWQIGLWSAQVLLSVFFAMSGAFKNFLEPEILVGMGVSYATQIPYWLLLFIGICEMAGAAGIVFPALTRIEPVFTPLAALGFVILQTLAIGFHLLRGEIGILPFNLILLSLSAFVLWGRTTKAPVRPRW